MKPIKRTKTRFDAVALFAKFRKLKWDAAGGMTWCFQFRYLAGAPIVTATAEALDLVAVTLGGPPKRVWPVQYYPAEARQSDPRFAHVQFTAVMPESGLSRLHQAFDALALKHGIDYGGVIAYPAQDGDFGQPGTPASSMHLDAAALFAHLRDLETRPKARRFRRLWTFDFRHQDFQHLSDVAEALLDGMIITLGRKPKRLEPSLAETRFVFDERGNKSKGPPVAEIVFTDNLAEDELAKLHAAFGALADRHGLAYEGVHCYDAPEAGWVRAPVFEPKSRRRSPRKGTRKRTRKTGCPCAAFHRAS